jgi:hypothetical protein
MHHSFNVLVLNTLILCFGISKCHHQGVRYEHAEMVPNVVESREGWELYIVTDSVMVGILLGEGSRWAPSLRNMMTITPSVTIHSSHHSLLPTTLGTISACSYLTP